MADGIKRTKLLQTVTAASLIILSSGLIMGFVLGSIAPENLPGVRRGVLPKRQNSDELVLQTAQAPEEAKETESTGASRNTKTAYDVKEHLGELPTDSEAEYMAWMQAHTQEDPEYLKARWALSRRYIESGELQGESIEAFLKTPRELFVREANLSKAYADSWLPIGYGATITDPDVVSMMTTTLAVKPEHKVLEIGTGSGYQSAILSFLTNHVYSIEIIEPLYRETNDLYNSLTERYPSFGNITRKLGDGFYGWEKYGPFDRIIVTCSIDHLPPPLIKQLTPNGIMVVPLGPPGRQYIMEVKKTVEADGTFKLTRRDVYNGLSVKFIPFTNDAGQSYSGG